MSSTITDLPDLSTPYDLSDSQVSDFQRDGHLLLRGVCSQEEIATYRRVLLDATMRNNKETRPIEERDTYGKAFLQVMNLWVNDEAARRFTLAKRFGKIAADILGVEAVRLYHDQALFKEPGGGHTPWHQDEYYWPLDSDKCVTMWMPLVDASAEMGTMTFASGSHTEGFLGHLEISDKSEEHFKNLVTSKGHRLTASGAMKAGDATFHSGWTLHSAPGNPTNTLREVMTIIYFADGTRILTPDNKNRQNDLDTWLSGQQPGELAGSPLNPVVYRRGE
jgi:ectoine hydroxylase-related dioxygenase (phytanoyl-CoA dioxygenase family)